MVIMLGLGRGALTFFRNVGIVPLLQWMTAGVAQLVERNLAKVEVASSRLVSRSRFPKEGEAWSLPFFLAKNGIKINKNRKKYVLTQIFRHLFAKIRFFLSRSNSNDITAATGGMVSSSETGLFSGMSRVTFFECDLEDTKPITLVYTWGLPWLFSRTKNPPTSAVIIVLMTF